jgi:hypothetical protein
MTVVVDGVTVASAVSLLVEGEDVLIRYPAGEFPAGSHTVTVTHAGPDGNYLYFDFFELAIPSTGLPSYTANTQMTLATDWDTEHSLVLAPERTAGMLELLGFTARENHYCGALWFYELVNPANVYATGTVTFTGTPTFGDEITVTIGTVGVPASDITLTKLVHEGMTAAMVALAYANELNRGYTALWASASGGVLTVQARTLGSGGDTVSIAASGSTTLTATASGASLGGGVDGTWLTDLAASPPVNRAARDWHTSFFTALGGYGIESTAAFSMELGNGDPSVGAGIAQRDSAGNPIVLPTPSIQTNFSPASLAYWEQVYAVMAELQASAGLTPYLQFGEVQWWYFPDDGDGHAFASMPFYDAWNLSQFLAEFGFALPVITTNTVNPASYPDEVSFLPNVIGNFTNSIMAFVRTTQPACRFEVLYPTDTNTSAFNQAINYPTSAWTPAALAVLKTEDFGFTLARDLSAAEGTMGFGQSLGFPASQRAQLVGISDVTSSWLKEAQSAAGKNFESVVLFALDQFCLIGYADPLPSGLRRSLRMGT